MSLPIDDDESEVLEVWHELQSAKDPQSREDLLIRLAECALIDHDFSNLETPDEIQDAFSELRASQAQYQVAALRVGRIVAQYMDVEDESAVVPCCPAHSPN